LKCIERLIASIPTVKFINPQITQIIRINPQAIRVIRGYEI